MVYAFDIVIDSEEARKFWADWIVLQLESERPENQPPPRVDEIVMEAIEYVRELPKGNEVDMILKAVFADAVQNSRTFTARLNLKKSHSWPLSNQ